MVRGILIAVILVFANSGITSALPLLPIPITYTFEGKGSGTAGDQSFTDAAFTLTLDADALGVVEPIPGVVANDVFSASMLIAGIGTFDFSEPTTVAVNQNEGLIRLIYGTTGGWPTAWDMYRLGSAGLVSYDLASAIGPLAGSSSEVLNFDINTSIGILEMDLIRNASFTAAFEPQVASVPEPATLLLVGAGLFGLGAWRRS